MQLAWLGPGLGQTRIRVRIRIRIRIRVRVGVKVGVKVGVGVGDFGQSASADGTRPPNSR